MEEAFKNASYENSKHGALWSTPFIKVSLLEPCCVGEHLALALDRCISNPSSAIVNPLNLAKGQNIFEVLLSYVDNDIYFVGLLRY